MSEYEFHQSVQKRRNSILIIWIIPVIALIIAGSMIVKYIMAKGEDIVIVFQSAEGFSIGKTMLKYKGIRIGLVSDMKINPSDTNEFYVTVTVDSSAIPLIARKGTKFWKVEPKVSMSEISGLNTIISGSYIEVLPGREALGPLSTRDLFTAETSIPIESFLDGFFITLRSEKGDISEGSPLLFKKYAVGKVVKKELKTGYFDYTLFVEQTYGDLIKEKSHFWNLSGFDLKASLSGLELNAGPLFSIIRGGIMFDSPADSKVLSDRSHVFELSDSKEDFLLDPRMITLISEEHLDIDPKLHQVYYRGVLAGKVVATDYLPKEEKTKISIQLNEKYYDLLKYETFFWIVKPRIALDGVSGLDALTKGEYIAFDTISKPSAPHKNYTLFDKKPLLQGKHYTMRVRDLGSLSSGDPIYYKRIKAGEVTGFDYNKKDDTVFVHFFIKEAFTQLVNRSTHFYRQSGIELDISRDHVRVSTQAMDTVLRGGLGFIVQDKAAENVPEGYQFLLYENEVEAKDESVFVTVSMDRGYKLSNGSQVLYKDLKIGYVQSLKFEDHAGVTARLAISKKHAELLHKDTLFWIDDFDVSVRGVKNTPAAVFGPSLCLMPGSSQEKASHFQLSEKAPFTTYSQEGLRITLKGSRKSSLRPGSPLLYRQLVIGSVERFELAPDGTSVDIVVFVEKKYAHVVRKNSLFYHAGAIGMKVNLTGIKIMTETLETMIYGGIGMATPDPAEEKAQNGDTFKLELDPKDDWFTWEPKLSR